MLLKGAMSRFGNFEMCSLKVLSSSFLIRVNLLHSSILVSLWFITIALVFFDLCKLLFSCFIQFKGNIVSGQNTVT